ncbi:ester cyclase [Flagellimonas okinawensis]|uniref:Ester cyclase n=1 Tax=Flagellimonas okinawensis TaxID=3031324 RepID=A0ABT5XTM7_9FLAO|nr:ester cyclase [[Muricauda] okinawensis]MDF0708911.1 ester cyclase [[Muricauda] okinawensis]
MDKEKLKNTASEYMQIWSAENADLLDKCADKNIVADYTHFEKPYKGVQNYKSMLKMTYDFFPDLKITIKNLIPNEVEQIVTVEWKYDGTHTNGNLFGVESSGKKISVSGITILEIEKGLVTKEKGIVDNLNLIMQLGALDN